jgi:hypothetical protein
LIMVLDYSGATYDFRKSASHYADVTKSFRRAAVKLSDTMKRELAYMLSPSLSEKSADGYVLRLIAVLGESAAPLLPHLIPLLSDAQKHNIVIDAIHAIESLGLNDEKVLTAIGKCALEHRQTVARAAKRYMQSLAVAPTSYQPPSDLVRLVADCRRSDPKHRAAARSELCKKLSLKQTPDPYSVDPVRFFETLPPEVALRAFKAFDARSEGASKFVPGIEALLAAPSPRLQLAALNALLSYPANDYRRFPVEQLSRLIADGRKDTNALIQAVVKRASKLLVELAVRRYSST